MPLNKVACLVLPNAATNHLYCYVLGDFSSWREFPISQSIYIRNKELFLGGSKVLMVFKGRFLSRGHFASMAP
jgi:hypothetical protein